jgi:hypothetical protein
MRVMMVIALVLGCSACADPTAVQTFAKMAPDPTAVQALTKD